MEYPKPKIEIAGERYELLNYEEFRERRGIQMVTNQTLINHMNADNLDFTIIGHLRFIIWNEKAKGFNLSYKKQLNSF
jgi:hypothetical protein